MDFSLRTTPFFVSLAISLTLSLPLVANAAAEPSHTLKVLWWNTGGGGYDTGRTNGPCSGALNQKLAELTAIDSLDIVALGESSNNGYFCPETLQLLEKNFPHHFSVPYNPTCLNNTIEVFSKLPMKLATWGTIDWSPIHSSKSEEWKNAWQNKYPYKSPFCQERPLAVFSGEFNGQAFNFVPVHLTDPWKALIDGRGNLRTGIEIFFGYNNPNYNQVQRLKEKLGKVDHQTPLIVIGDFNFPPSYLGYRSTGFSAMTHGQSLKLKRLFEMGKYASYPAAADKSKIPPILIDQAYGTFEFQSFYFKVLNWPGSDHYPIMLSVQLGQSAK